MSSAPIITFLAFKELTDTTAVLAGSGVVNSTRYIDDPQYIVVPAALYKDIFIYYSFNNKPLGLYRLRRDMDKKMHRVIGSRSKVRFQVSPTTGPQKFDIREMILNWEENLRLCSRK